MSFETLKKCLKSLRLQDKKPLSQKLIVRYSRIREFWTTTSRVQTFAERFEETEAESLGNIAMFQIQE